jgi:tRNA modification GTPase
MKDPPKPRQASYRLITDPETQKAVDRAVVLFFPKPQSFTMEDTVEFQVHGSLAVTKRMLSLLGKIPNLHPAEPVNDR